MINCYCISKKNPNQTRIPQQRSLLRGGCAARPRRRHSEASSFLNDETNFRDKKSRVTTNSDGAICQPGRGPGIIHGSPSLKKSLHDDVKIT